MLFENSIVCLVVFVCFWLPVWGTPRLPVSWVAVFLMPVFGVFLLGQACSDSDSPAGFVGWVVFVWRV